ncbi:hypothetical protein ABIC45_002253 [Mucilaginibacter rubeus]
MGYISNELIPAITNNLTEKIFKKQERYYW